MSIESLPPFFPITLTGCVDPAENFFACINEKTDPMGSTDVAHSALRACKHLQLVYEKCIRTTIAKPNAKRPTVLLEWEP